MRLILSSILFMLILAVNVAHAANYVLIVAGQSNAVGRAPNPVYGAAAGHTYTKTKIWVTNLAQVGSGGSAKFSDAPTVSAWQTLNPSTNQSYDGGGTIHGIEPWLAYLFENDPNHSNDTLYIIKLGYGGIPLGITTGMDYNPSSTQELYNALVNYYLVPALGSTELTGNNYTPLGIWWAQGETDAAYSTGFASSYETNLNALFSGLASNIPALSNFRKYIAQCGTQAYTGGAYSDVVRAAELSYASNPSNNSKLILTDDVSRRDDQVVHYSAQGFYQLATKLYDAINTIPATPVLNFSDITSGPKTGNTDGEGSGAIVTIWGNNLGSTKGASKVYIGDVEATKIYYWKDADGQLPGGPADLKTYHKMQEIAFAVPATAVDGANTIKVIVGGVDSNTLPFTVRSGNIYFVKSTGNDSTGNGSWASPWATLANVMNGGNGKLTAGDIVYSAGVGTTSEISLGVGGGLVGTESNPFSFISYPNTRSVFDVNQAAYAIRNYNGHSHFLNFSKLTFINPTQAIGLTEKMRVIGNTVTNPTLPGGYSGWLGGNCTASTENPTGDPANCGGAKIYGNEIYNYGRSDGTTYSFHHLIYISNRSGNVAVPYEIAWNNHHDNPIYQGIHIYDMTPCGGWSGTFKIHHNVVKNQGGGSININNGCPELFNAEIHDNLLITDTDYNAPGSGAPGVAIRVGVATGSTVKIFNNTMYGYGQYGFNFETIPEYRNNIIVDTRGLPYLYGTNAPNPRSNNIYYSTAGTPPTGLAWATNADPKFINSATYDFSLQPGSPALNAGYNTTATAPVDFLGSTRSSTPDIGAFGAGTGGTPINGTCGSANGGSFSTAPATNLCTTGTPSSVTGQYLWTCSGSNGGTTTNCSASYSAPQGPSARIWANLIGLFR